jgi:phage baseplate assembly protein W
MLSQSDPVGNGIRYPFQVTSTGGIAFSGAPKGELMNDEYRRRVIRQSIRQIIFTARGEWVMRRTFGSLADQVPFQPTNQAVPLLSKYVIDAITTFEKRVNQIYVIIDDSNVESGRLMIEVSYTIIRTGTSDNMTYPWYLAEFGV